MHTLTQIIELLSSPLLHFVDLLTPAIAAAGHHSPTGTDATIAAFAVTTALIGLSCVYWAAWTHARLGNFRIEVRRRESQLESSLRLRDALLTQSRQPIVILGAELAKPVSYNDGAAHLEAALAGPDAPVLAPALDKLLTDGVGFELSVRTVNAGRIVVQAQPVLGRAIVYLKGPAGADTLVDFRGTLDAVPIPVWVRDSDLQLRWANATFLNAIAGPGGRQELAADMMLDRSERDLAIAARDGAEITNAKRYMTVAGQRRALNVNLSRLADSSIACSAIDVTDFVKTEAEMQIAADATADMLDKISVAIAVFDEGKRLTSNNALYARMWNFPQHWLDTRPSQSDILDRLRELRLVPEQRDFAGWKTSNLELFEDGGRSSEEYWHMPNGRSLRVISRPHLQGGLFFTFEDVSEQFRLQSTLASRAAVQKATLDTIEDAVAIFEPDGRLCQYNRPFLKLWRLTDEELSGGPHFSKIAALCSSRIGRDDIWEIVSSAVASLTPERYGEWGNIDRSDGHVLSLVPARLPDGATLITFRDVTDVVRFESFLSDTSYHAA